MDESQVIKNNLPPGNCQDAVNSSRTCWEYKVVHINFKDDDKEQASTPETASQKLQGSLSPEFIKREFPEIYKQESLQQKHPALQIQDFLSLVGNEGWELLEISQLGGIFYFFFKRPKLAMTSEGNKF